MKNAKIIEITGIDGCGKTTQAKLAVDYLNEKGVPVKLIATGTSLLIGHKIRKIDDNNIEVSAYTRALMFATDYSWLFSKSILPALLNGVNIIMDRYIYSAIAYNKAFGLEIEWSKNLYSFALWPELVLLIDVDPRLCYQRIIINRGRLSIYETGKKATSKLKFLEFQKKVREIYLSLAKRNKKISVINGNTSIDEVQYEIQRVLTKILKLG